MPGVPSSRGCDACRRQKKKCDQAKPACARCKRLGIQCSGAGQQRFKFVQSGPTDEDISTTNTSTGSGSGGPPGTSGRTPSAASVAAPALRPLTIIRMPASQDALIAGSMASRLRVTDIRYDTSCFGSFLRYIPERIGCNKALDTAADAFAATFTNLHHARDASTQCFVKHGHALKALRDTMGSPTQATDPETICAIYLTMLTEGLLRDEPGRHVEAMAYILQTGTFRKWKSPFELEMLNVMCFNVLMESVGNPNVQLEPWLTQLLNKLHPREELRGPARSSVGAFPSLDMWSMARMARILRAPWKYHDELASVYEGLMADIGRLRIMLDEYLAREGHPRGHPEPSKLYRAAIVHLSMGTALALIHNRILQDFEGEDLAALRETADALIEETLGYGEQSLPYRPLGATHVLPGLNICWAISDDHEVMYRASTMIRQVYKCGFPNPDRTREPWWWRMKFAHIGRQIKRARTPPRLEGGSLDDGDDEVFQPQCHTQ